MLSSASWLQCQTFWRHHDFCYVYFISTIVIQYYIYCVVNENLTHNAIKCNINKNAKASGFTIISEDWGVGEPSDLLRVFNKTSKEKQNKIHSFRWISKERENLKNL